VSNDPTAPALEVAARYGVRAIAIDHRPFGKDRAAHERALVAALDEAGVQFVVLAGYMRLLTPLILDRFACRMINIHPSLLPSFPGVGAAKQAVEYGVRFSGCTVHFVTAEMDGGPIILQRMVPVLPLDTEHTLGARILMEEHLALPACVDLFTRGLLNLEGRRVTVMPGTTSYPEVVGGLPTSVSVLIASGNAHKVQEITAILSEVALTFRSTADFGNLTEPEENAPDYLGNALIKARTWNERSGLWTLADDSGLEVDALNGRPGVLSARYASTAAERNRKLLAELQVLPMEQRRARFVCTVALCGGSGREYHATGVCEGHIAFEARGLNGFGYDPIFVPEGFGGRHLAELSESTKNNISHRARALFGLKPLLERLARGTL
jgi:phosphoribosylglycinamide formyltransferase-1